MLFQAFTPNYSKVNEYMDFKHFNCIVVFNKEKDSVLFCKRIKDPYKGLYNFVGGKVEPGESSDEAAYRELQEETGISSKDIDLYRLMDFTYYHQQFILEIYVGVLEKDIELQEETNPLEWLSLYHDFTDRTRFAGDQNIGHIINVALMYPIPEKTDLNDRKLTGIDGSSTTNEEQFDITDERGFPTGKTVSRSKAHEKGILHRTAHTWIVRKNGDSYQVLLQKRSADKDSFPSMYDTSSAGHILAGDTPLETAARELKEELGIEIKQDCEFKLIGKFRIKYEKEFHGKMFRDNEVAFVYIYDEPVDETKLVLQDNEVENVKWFDVEEVYEGCVHRDGTFCVPMEGLELIMKYLKGL